MIRRGGRIVDATRFRDALEGMDPRDIREARAHARRVARCDLVACGYAGVAVLGAVIWTAVAAFRFFFA